MGFCKAVDGHEKEGVVKFSSRCLAPENSLNPAETAWLNELLQLQRHCLTRGWLGRADGVAFGNLSTRLERGFAISPTQASDRLLAPADFCRITASSDTANRVDYEGPLPPSSETLSHAALYGSAAVRVVVHIHNRALFTRLPKTGCAVTPANIEYGTVAMSNAVASVAEHPSGRLVMLGHPGGIMIWAAGFEQMHRRLQHLAEIEDGL